MTTVGRRPRRDAQPQAGTPPRLQGRPNDRNAPADRIVRLLDDRHVPRSDGSAHRKCRGSVIVQGDARRLSPVMIAHSERRSRGHADHSPRNNSGATCRGSRVLEVKVVARGPPFAHRDWAACARAEAEAGQVRHVRRRHPAHRACRRSTTAHPDTAHRGPRSTCSAPARPPPVASIGQAQHVDHSATQAIVAQVSIGTGIVRVSRRFLERREAAGVVPVARADALPDRPQGAQGLCPRR